MQQQNNATNSLAHTKCKKAEKIATYDGIAPLWFRDGIEFLLYAPTAYNKQDFIVKGNENKVSLRSESGSFGKLETGMGNTILKLVQGRKILNGLRDFNDSQNNA